MDATAETWWGSALVFVRENETLIEAIVFGLGFAESLVLVSFFVPASPLFLAIAAIEAAAGGPFLPLLIAGTLGAFLGDMLSFALGGWFKDDLPNHWPFRRYPGWLSGARLLFERRGMSAIVMSKFVGPLRPVIPVVAGAAHMPWPAFAAASLGSCVLWAAAFLAPAYYGIKVFG